MPDTTVQLSITVDQEWLLKALLAAMIDARKPVLTINFGPISDQKEQR